MCATPSGATDNTKKTRRPLEPSASSPNATLENLKRTTLSLSEIATGDNGQSRPYNHTSKTKEASRQSFRGLVLNTNREERVQIGGRSQRRLGAAIDDQRQHHATEPTTSQHRKQRYAPPPLAKLAIELERAPIHHRRRQKSTRPYQDTKDRATEP